MGYVCVEVKRHDTPEIIEFAEAERELYKRSAIQVPIYVIGIDVIIRRMF